MWVWEGEQVMRWEDLEAAPAHASAPHIFRPHTFRPHTCVGAWEPVRCIHTGSPPVQ